MDRDLHQVEQLKEELSMVEFESGRLLDDQSLKLMAALRARNVLTEEEWAQIKAFLRKALDFLTASKDQKLPESEEPPIIDFAIIDADPRNADWIKIAGVNRRTGVALPNWAALWIWWLRNNESMMFWRRVGRIAKEIGFPPLPRTVGDDEITPAPSIVILHRLKQGEPPLGQLSSSEERWLRTAFTYLRRIDHWRRKNGSNAHCIFECGCVYLQCLAPPHGRYLRCEAVSDKYVTEVASILSPEKQQELTNELGFSAPGASKNFSRKIEIEGQRDLAFVARLAFRVLRDVYGVRDFGSSRFTIAPAHA
jgi:hypothetical protein